MLGYVGTRTLLRHDHVGWEHPYHAGMSWGLDPNKKNQRTSVRMKYNLS